MTIRPRSRPGDAGPDRAAGRQAPRRRQKPVLPSPDALADLGDPELLTLVFARRGVAKPAAAAARVLGQFGSLAGALGTPHPELARASSAEAALDLKVMHEAAVRLARAQISPRDVLSSTDAVCVYLKVLLAGHPREQVWGLFLGTRNQLLASEKLAEGTVDHAPVYPREIMRRALELNARALILVHNHPSGDPTPSRSDISMTQEVVAAGRTLKITVHDHLVVGQDGVVSLKALGLM